MNIRAQDRKAVY